MASTADCSCSTTPLLAALQYYGHTTALLQAVWPYYKLSAATTIVLCSSVQYTIVLCSSVQYTIVLCSTMQHYIEHRGIYQYYRYYGHYGHSHRATIVP
jgi:hypothetical protein